jgi:hypothetical protein
MPRKISSGVATATGSLGTLSIVDNTITTVAPDTNIVLDPNGTGDVVTSKPLTINGSASSDTSTGALRVTGGLAVTGNINVGGTLTTSTGLNTAVGTTAQAAARFTTLTASGLSTISEVAEVIGTKTSASGVVVHNFTEANTWYHSSIGGNFTVNLTNVPTTNNRVITISLILIQGGTGYYASGFEIDGVAQTINWAGLTNPVPVANAFEIQTFTLVRQSSTWSVVGNLSSYAAQSVLGTSSIFAATGTQQLRRNGITTNGVYWIKPPTQATAYQCYCIFNQTGTTNNDWIAVSGMAATGVRADANGRSSGLAALNINGENTSAAQLTTTNTQNNNGINFTLPREWINSLRPRALRVTSTAEDMVCRFDRTGSYVTVEDIWAFYYAANGFNTVPYANGARLDAGVVGSWLSQNGRIFADGGATAASGVPILWSGSQHCGWSTATDNRHMLHGTTNETFPGTNRGFCLDNTCWNQSGIVYMAATV